jgi:hypothetical protein
VARVIGSAIEEALLPSFWNSSTAPAPLPVTTSRPSRIELGSL